MTTTDWIAVGGFLLGGVILGLVLSRIVHMLLGRPTRPKPLQDAAKPLGALAFWAGVMGGLIGAVGILSPDSLDEIPANVLAYLPNVLSAAIIIIAANVLVSFALAALGQALARASASVQRQVATAVRVVVMGLAVLLATILRRSAARAAACAAPCSP